MPDLLSPRFLARVERSLRKRINTDIHPHLLRFAAHSKCEQDLIASASRLLLNPKERERWVASWVQRLPKNAAFDATLPASLDTTSPGHLQGVRHAIEDNTHQDSTFESPVTPEQLEEIRSALMTELGPAASALVDTEAARAHSTSDLLDRLQAYLPQAQQRIRFVNSNI
jgi:hypothetical protein